MRIMIEETAHGGEVSTLCSLVCELGRRLHREQAAKIRAAGGRVFDGATGRDCTVAARMRHQVRSLAEQLAAQAPGDWPGCLRSNLTAWERELGTARDDAALAAAIERQEAGR
jgi:hypothetical protein